MPLSASLDDKWQSDSFVDDKGRPATFPAFMDDASCPSTPASPACDGVTPATRPRRER